VRAFWDTTSELAILVDILVIYALVAHGGRIDDDWRTTDNTTDSTTV
jgi:hypothetical protein